MAKIKAKRAVNTDGRATKLLDAMGKGERIKMDGKEWYAVRVEFVEGFGFNDGAYIFTFEQAKDK